MRYRTLFLLGLSVLVLAGCRSSNCGSGPSLWDRLTHRKSSEPCCPGMPMGEAAFMGGGCNECAGCAGATTSMLPEAEPLLTAPAKVGTDGKPAAPGYAEPMPFNPKKPN